MKTALILFLVFLGFGTVGRMDYEDALAYESAQLATQETKLATQDVD